MSINYETATLAQLSAEIQATGRSIRSLAKEMDQDYTSLYRWVTGKRTMHLTTLYDVLSTLDVNPETFFKRVQERAEQAAKEG